MRRSSPLASPSCSSRPSRSATPQCSITLPPENLKTSIVSNSTSLPVAGQPRNGFEFLAEFRKDAAMRRVPVVVVTAADLTEEDRRRLNGAVERILQKAAYSNVELMDELRELIYRGIRKTG